MSVNQIFWCIASGDIWIDSGNQYSNYDYAYQVSTNYFRSSYEYIEPALSWISDKSISGWTRSYQSISGWPTYTGYANWITTTGSEDIPEYAGRIYKMTLDGSFSPTVFITTIPSWTTADAIKISG